VGGGTWTRCASEHGTCSFSGSKEVRYGANGKYHTKTVTGPVKCNNGVFNDPISGVLKHCDYSSSTKHRVSDEICEKQNRVKPPAMQTKCAPTASCNKWQLEPAPACSTKCGQTTSTKTYGEVKCVEPTQEGNKHVGNFHCTSQGLSKPSAHQRTCPATGKCCEVCAKGLQWCYEGCKDPNPHFGDKYADHVTGFTMNSGCTAVTLLDNDEELLQVGESAQNEQVGESAQNEELLQADKSAQHVRFTRTTTDLPYDLNKDVLGFQIETKTSCGDGYTYLPEARGYRCKNYQWPPNGGQLTRVFSKAANVEACAAECMKEAGANCNMFSWDETYKSGRTTTPCMYNKASPGCIVEYDSWGASVVYLIERNNQHTDIPTHYETITPSALGMSCNKSCGLNATTLKGRLECMVNTAMVNNSACEEHRIKAPTIPTQECPPTERCLKDEILSGTDHVVDGFHYWGHAGDKEPIWKGCYGVIKAYQTLGQPAGFPANFSQSLVGSNLGKNREIMMVWKYPGGYPEAHKIKSVTLSMFKSWDGSTHNWKCNTQTNYILRLLKQWSNFNNGCDETVESTKTRSYTVFDPPVSGSTALGFHIASSTKKTITVDVTALLKHAINSGLTDDGFGFMISGTQHGCLSAFDSAESATASQRPKLDIKLH